MSEASLFSATVMLDSARRVLRGLPASGVKHLGGESILAGDERYSAMLIAGRAGESAFADAPIEDSGPIATMLRDGAWQNPDTFELRLAPVTTWPCMVFAPWVLTPSGPPPPSSRLWLRVSYKLTPFTWERMEPLPFDPNAAGTQYEKVTRTGWNLGIDETALQHAWLPDAEVPENQIFPGIIRESLPKNGVFIWHWLLGTTDEQGIYTPIPGVHSTTLNPFS